VTITGNRPISIAAQGDMVIGSASILPAACAVAARAARVEPDLPAGRAALAAREALVVRAVPVVWAVLVYRLSDEW